MFENRSLKLDLFSLLLLVVAALVGTALWTYDATDPPSTLVFPPKETVSNACGFAGAYVAHYLFSSVGYAALYVTASLIVTALILIFRRAVDQPVLRGFGWTASLIAISTLATMALPNYTPGPEIGAGGYVGAMGHALLESHFAAFGAYILAFAVLLAGILLSTDYFLLRFATTTTAVGGAGLMKVGRIGGHVASLGSHRRKTDLDDVAELEDGEEADDDDEYEYDEDEEAEGEDEEYEYEEGDEADAEWEDEEEEDSEPLTIKTPNKEVAEKEAAPDQPAEQANAHGAAAVAAGLKEKLAGALRIKNPNTKRDERTEIIEQLEAADHQGVDDLDYQLPPLDLLLEAEDVCYEDYEREVRRRAKVLEKTFANFGFNVKVVEIETGPVIAQYELELEAGLRLAKIMNLADDIAVALRVPGVRIVAPLPGKNSVGIEVPNETRQVVRMREVIEEANGKARRMKIPIYLGKDVTGNPMVVDLAKLPHLLIAGRTGTGKSVCLNSIIVSMLMSRGPDEVRMLMIDPKMVELSGYKKLPHLMHPVVTDMRKAEAILAWSVDKMEERYELLARAGVRQISVYNELSEEELRDRIQPRSDAEWEQIPKNLPYIVIVADEMADLIMTCGKEVQDHIIRLAQKSRAVGIHLILATQKPTVDVITGLIKSNLPARIAFQVASRTDSQVVLDANGADKLLGNGDMLFLSPGTSTLLRGQGTYLSDDEITDITDFVGTDSPQFAKELIELKTKEEQEAASAGGPADDRDELYNEAVEIVIREQRGSVSLLQRCLSIGYGRAARLIDFMAEDGVVAAYNGAKAREVTMTMADWLARNGEEEPEVDPDEPVTAVTVPPKPPRPTKITPPAHVDEPSDLEDEPPAKPPSGRRIRLDGPDTDRSFGATEPPVLEPTTAATAMLAAPVTKAASATAPLEDIAPWEDEVAEVSTDAIDSAITDIEETIEEELAADTQHKEDLLEAAPVEESAQELNSSAQLEVDAASEAEEDEPEPAEIVEEEIDKEASDEVEEEAWEDEEDEFEEPKSSEDENEEYEEEDEYEEDDSLAEDEAEDAEAEEWYDEDAEVELAEDEEWEYEDDESREDETDDEAESDDGEEYEYDEEEDELAEDEEWEYEDEE